MNADFARSLTPKASDCVRSLTPKAVCVGFSGGLDSCVLLDMLHRQGDHALAAVHVHHGLSPNADTWAEHARAFCEARGVPLDVVRVEVDHASPLGIEGAAREARYAVYAARPEPVVALAHHRDDQAETVLLQLLRGTGLKGAAAMPELRALNARVTLWRPLLDTPRAELLAYAGRHGLAWVDDESNASPRHDRNYLRLALVPLLEARFPHWTLALSRFARHAAEADALLESLAEIDGLPADLDAPLPLDPALPVPRRHNLVRAWLARQGLPMPGESRLEEIVRQAFGARGDARVEIEHGGVRLVRSRDALHVDAGAAPSAREWRGEPKVPVGEQGEVEFAPAMGEGIAAARVSGNGEWRLAPRAGGERMRLAPDRPTRTLKNLLQEHRVPWWQRQNLPLLFHGDVLVWVPGVGIAAEYACPAGEPGLKPAWRVAGKPALC